MARQLELIQEISNAIATATVERRAQITDRIAELFTLESLHYSSEEINLFDDVFVYLVSVIEKSARASLANRLATNRQAPETVCRALASDDEIEIAAPILEHSVRLDRATLVENARTQSQQHLLAISKRKQIEEAVTDVLVARGERSVVLSTVQNAGARFSEFGYVKLVDRSDSDEELTTTVGLRSDLPRHHFLKLLAHASAAVRSKLEAADPLGFQAIRKTVAEATSLVQIKSAAESNDYTLARKRIASLFPGKQLQESDLRAFAVAGKFEETVIGLTIFCDLSLEQIESALIARRPETLLILTKAFGMSWSTVKPMLTMRRSIADHEIEQCLGTFSRLKVSTARRIVEFQRARNVTAFGSSFT